MKYLIATAFCLAAMITAHAENTISTLELKDIDGNATSLKKFEGKVLLIVNVASHCGYTPQYAGLEALQQKYKDKGFTVLGFPCNQFGQQEPGTELEIKQFCSTKYNVTFPMFSKIDVNGPKRDALYTFLAGPDSAFKGDIKWNFTKFLVGRDGKIVKRFDSGTKPESEELNKAIEESLAGGK